MFLLMNIKEEYEKLRRKVEDSTRDSYLLDADDELTTFSNAKPNNHSTIVKVLYIITYIY